MHLIPPLKDAHNSTCESAERPNEGPHSHSVNFFGLARSVLASERIQFYSTYDQYKSMKA